MSGLRKEKSAKLRYLLGKSLARELKEHNFQDIKVTDLCKEVGVSKVTFFKYFPCKEELLRYYFRVWCLEIGVELHKSSKKGLEGIYYLFEKVFKSLNERPTFLPELVSYQMRDNQMRAPFPITKIERHLYYPKVDELDSIEIKSLGQHLDTFVLEAILDNNISSANPKQVTKQLHMFLLGNIVHSSMFDKMPNHVEIKQRVDGFIGGYGGQ